MARQLPIMGQTRVLSLAMEGKVCELVASGGTLSQKEKKDSSVPSSIENFVTNDDDGSSDDVCVMTCVCIMYRFDYY